jgi:hypothetical protein
MPSLTSYNQSNNKAAFGPQINAVQLSESADFAIVKMSHRKGFKAAKQILK